MSSTEIYAVTPNSCQDIANIRNAWRGAMYVWNDIAKRYFGLQSFPHFDEKMAKRIWNAGNEKPLILSERIVLASTMDRVTVKSSDAKRLCDAFDEYAAAHPNSSIGEQSEVIKNYQFGDGEKIAWCQTNVCEFQFSPEYDEEENPTYNDLSSSWDLFEQIDETEPA